MFRATSAHHQENQLYQYIIWYISLCVGDCLVCHLLDNMEKYFRTKEATGEDTKQSRKVAISMPDK
jgi:hypothetical protein